MEFARKTEMLRIEFRPTKDAERIQVTLNSPVLPLIGGVLQHVQQTLTVADLVPVRIAYAEQVQLCHELEAVGMAVAPDPQPLLALGRRVADLLPVPAQQGIVAAIERSRRRECLLRIVLMCTEETQAVLMVPWELLALPWQAVNRDDFVLQDVAISLVRQVRGTGRQLVPQLNQPLSVQALLADPLDGRQLAYASTYAALAQVLTPEGVRAAWYAGSGTLVALAERLRTRSPQVLHLLCHGDETPLNYGVRHDLIFTHQDGQMQRVSAFELAPLLSLAPRLQLVVLQACHAGSTPQVVAEPVNEHAAGERRAIESIALALVRQGVPAVVAMQGEVGQEAAGAFVQTLYAELSCGKGLDAAVAAGRLAMRAAGASLDWSLPVLYQGSEPVETQTWYTRFADRTDAALQDPVVQRTLRGLLLAWVLVLLVASVSNWLLIPGPRYVSLGALVAPLAAWLSIGLVGPAVIAAGQRWGHRADGLTPELRRAATYAQWAGAYLGFALAGLVSVSLWISLWMLGVFVLLPPPLPLLCFGVGLFGALSFSYVTARSQRRSALTVTPVDGSLYSLATISVILIGALVMMLIPLSVFWLDRIQLNWLLNPGPGGLTLALMLLSITILGSQ